MTFIINVITKEQQYYLLRQQKDINLEDILNYNGINQEKVKKINQLLYFLLIKEKNILPEMIIILSPVFLMKAQDLEVLGQKYIFIKL